MAIDIEQVKHNLKKVPFDLGSDVMNLLELDFLSCLVSTSRQRVD